LSYAEFTDVVFISLSTIWVFWTVINTHCWRVLCPK